MGGWGRGADVVVVVSCIFVLVRCCAVLTSQTGNLKFSAFRQVWKELKFGIIVRGVDFDWQQVGCVWLLCRAIAI